MARALGIIERIRADGLRVSLPTFCYLLLSSVSQPFAIVFYLFYRWPPLAAFFCPLIPLVRNILTLMRIRAPGKTPANPEGESESLYRGSKADWDHRATQTCSPCRGTSPIRNRATLAPYSSFMSRALWWSWGGVRFFMSEVPL